MGSITTRTPGLPFPGRGGASNAASGRNDKRPRPHDKARGAIPLPDTSPSAILSCRRPMFPGRNGRPESPVSGFRSRRESPSQRANRISGKDGFRFCVTIAASCAGADRLSEPRHNRKAHFRQQHPFATTVCRHIPGIVKRAGGSPSRAADCKAPSLRPDDGKPLSSGRRPFKKRRKTSLPIGPRREPRSARHPARRTGRPTHRFTPRSTRRCRGSAHSGKTNRSAGTAERFFRGGEKHPGQPAVNPA